MGGFKGWLYRFMYGRYGGDQLNWFLLIFGLATNLVNSMTIRLIYIEFISYALYFFALFRMFSKNISRRRKENNTFLNFFRPITRRYKLIKKQRADSAHRYFLCPKCKQQIRVPQGKGKIEITCPKCKHKFVKKT